MGLTGIFNINAPTTMNRCFSELARECALKPPGWREHMRACLTQVMIYLLRHHGGKIALPQIGNDANKLAQLVPAFDVIERKYRTSSMSIHEISKAACVSEVYLRKLFQQCLGISPVPFIQQRRISHACRLLRQTESGLKEIANASGFSDVYYFCRVFRKVMHSTPGNYRSLPETHFSH